MAPRKAKTMETGDQRWVDLVTRLMAIPGQSGDESGVADFIRQHLAELGVSKRAVRSDAAHKQSHVEGDTGNLVLRLKGTRRGPRRMLVAHMDTVPICVGSQPERRNGTIVSTAEGTGLGSDDRAGCAVLLATLTTLLEQQIPHPPLTFLWTVQEEVGLGGARHVRKSLLGKPAMCFNFDGGAAAKLTIGATGAYRLQIDVRGVASHAGVAPEEGVSAIAIASLAIADLQSNGWHGLVTRRGKSGTCNVGVFDAGGSTNVVADRATLRAEARSHDARFRKRIVSEIEKAFRKAARSVKSATGKQGEVTIESRLDYESYKMPLSSEPVQRAVAAVQDEGCEPDYAVANGGLDANWLTAHGYPCVSLGCGQKYIHTVDEVLDIDQFLLATRIAVRLASGEAP